MSPLFLAPLLLLARVHGMPQPEDGECCTEKMVGGVSYTLLGTDDSGMFMELSCLSNCVFEKDGLPGSKFCFGRGDMSVECQGDMMVTPPAVPEGETGGPGDLTGGPGGETEGPGGESPPPPPVTEVPGEGSFLAGLSYTWDTSASPFCAGTLLANRWVVTSASCSFADSSKVLPTTVKVSTGDTGQGGQVDTSEVDMIIVHPGYTHSGIGDNLALWRLKSDATKVSLSCLPQQGSQQTGTAKLLGWRISELPGSLSEKLEEREVTLVEDCGQQKKLCSTAATTQCGGDYGGPLLQGDGVLVGLSVSDTGCGGQGDKGLFTQLSEYTAWIQSTLSANGGGEVCTA